jgi:hypothetical protein
VLANRNVPNGAEPILKVIGLPPGIPDAALHEMPDQLRSALTVGREIAPQA